MTEYVVTVGSGKPGVCRGKSLFDAISYAEMYAGRHIANVFVHTNEGQIVFFIEAVDGQLYSTDCDAQQAEWEQFVGEGI